MSWVIMDTMKPWMEYKKNEVWTSEWAQVSLLSPPQPTTLLLLLSARSLSLSHGTRAHLAQPCGLNWIRHTRLFRHCAVAWESPSQLHEGKRKERHRQHLSEDLRVADSQRWKGRRETKDHQPPIVPRLSAKRRVRLYQGCHYIWPWGVAKTYI